MDLSGSAVLIQSLEEEARKLRDRCEALTEENQRIWKVNAENSGLRWQLDLLRGFIKGLLPHLSRAQVRDAERVALDIQKNYAGIEGERRPWKDLLNLVGA